MAYLEEKGGLSIFELSGIYCSIVLCGLRITSGALGLSENVHASFLMCQAPFGK